MLVLKRKVGEAIVIDRNIVATVVIIGDDFVELGLSNLSGGQLGTIVLLKTEYTHIAHGVYGIVVQLRPNVRLGFECPKTITLERQEFT